MKCIFKTGKTWLPLRFLAMGMMLMGWPVQAEALDVRVHEAPVRTVLAGLARSAGINLVIDNPRTGGQPESVVPHGRGHCLHYGRKSS